MAGNRDTVRHVPIRNSSWYHTGMQNSSSDLYDVIRVFFETKVDAVILDFQMTGGFDAGSGMFPCAAIIRWCYKNNIEQKPLQ